jgi:DNA invertase Pin-like site-specific DNA recombinase
MADSTAQDTTAVEEAVALAIGLSVRTRSAREMAERVEAARDAAIRRATSLGVNREEFARQLGIARSRLYVVMNEPNEDDPELWEWLAQMDDLALDRWHQNDEEGSPDDYWPGTL